MSRESWRDSTAGSASLSVADFRPVLHVSIKVTVGQTHQTESRVVVDSPGPIERAEMWHRFILAIAVTICSVDSSFAPGQAVTGALGKQA